MATTTLTHHFEGKQHRNSVLTNFMNWSTAQEYNRLLWVGLGLGIHGCVTTPLTVLLLLIFAPGIGLLPIALAIVAMTAVLVVNLAALPTKITIPVFAASLLVDVLLIITAFVY